MKSKGKVKNATAVDAYGLHFRSKLELYTYEAFMKAGIPVKYEPKHFTLFRRKSASNNVLARFYRKI